LTIQIWRAYNRSIIYSLQAILNSGYSIILSVVFIGISFCVASFSQVTARIVGMNVIAILLGLYFIWRRLNAGGVFFNRQHWHYGLAISIPLMGHVLSTQVLSRADQILIQNIVGETETGIYSLAYRIGEIPSLLLLAFGSVWGVWFFDRMKNNEYEAVREKSVLYALGFSIAVLGCMIIGPFLLQITTPPEYWSARRLVPVIMAGVYWMMLYSLFGVAEQYDKKMQYLAVATAIAAVFNIVTNILLLPHFGYQIAAWTTVASYMLMAFIHIWVVRSVLKRPNLFRMNVLLLIGTGITLLAFILFNIL
jgi:O-antigen/teichoic acid export membrane protein